MKILCVKQRLTVGGFVRREAAVFGDLHLRSSGKWNAPNLGASCTKRAEIKPFPVARPEGHALVYGFGRDSSRCASGGLHNIDTPVAILPLRIEADPAAIGRPAGRALLASDVISHLDGFRSIGLCYPDFLDLSRPRGFKRDFASIGRELRIVVNGMGRNNERSEER